MSAQATFWAWEQTVEGSSKFVLLALADFADDDDDTCAPSKAMVAERTGLSSKTVQRALRELEQLRLIEREDRLGDDGARTSNAYRLLLPEGVVR